MKAFFKGWIAGLAVGAWSFFPVFCFAQFTPPQVSTFTELQTEIDARFTNSLSLIYPPHLEFSVDIGIISTTDSNLLAHLPVQTDSGYPYRRISVTESSGFPATRSWSDSSGQPFTNVLVSVSYHPTNFVLSNFTAPSYLTSTNLDAWIQGYLLSRQTLSFDLLATNDLPLFLAALSNSAASGSSSPLGSNDIGALQVHLSDDKTSMHLVLQAPTNVQELGVYATDDLIHPFPWELLNQLSNYDVDPSTDPDVILIHQPLTDAQCILTIANHSLDSDGDGLLDATELLQLGTQTGSADSDGDGLSDSEEVLEHQSDPLNEDSDADGLLDGWEANNGFNPNDASGIHGGNGDSDGDGLSNRIEQGLGTDPHQADSVRPLSSWDVGVLTKGRKNAREKGGFWGFLSYSNPAPNYYLSLIRDDIHHYQGKDSNCFHHADVRTKYDLSLTLDPDTMTFTGQGDEDYHNQTRSSGQPWVTQQERHLTVNWSNQVGTETSYTITGGQRCCDATNTFCGRGPYGEHGSILYGELDYDDPEVTVSETSYLDTRGSNNSEPHCSDRTVEISYTLSGPYTTSNLLEDAERDLTALGQDHPWSSLPWSRTLWQWFGVNRGTFDPGYCPPFPVSTGTFYTARAYRNLGHNSTYRDETRLDLWEAKYAFSAYTLSTGQVYRIDWMEYLVPEDTNFPKTVTGSYRTYFMGKTNETVYLGNPEHESDPAQTGAYVDPQWENAESEFLLSAPTESEGDGFRYLDFMVLDVVPDRLLVSVEETNASVSLSWDSEWDEELGGGVLWTVTPTGLGNITVLTNQYGIQELHFTPSNSVPGIYTVRAELEHLPEVFDESKVTVLKVELESDEAANSPQTFKHAETSLNSPCGKELEDQEGSLVIYYNEVFNYQTEQVEDFDVTLKVSPTSLQGVTWSKEDGPASGTLINTSQAEATFQNPKEGGLYEFDMELNSVVTKTQVLLPVAGPDISQWFSDEIDDLDTFADNYRANLGPEYLVPGLAAYLRASDFGVMAAAADWLGQFTNDAGPCGGPVAFNVHDARHTIEGVVIERHKLSNILTAYMGRNITRLPEAVLTDLFNDYGTPDDDYGRASYRIGYDIFSGISISTAFQTHGHDTQAPGSWAAEEWPNPGPPTGGGITRPNGFQ